MTRTLLPALLCWFLLAGGCAEDPAIDDDDDTTDAFVPETIDPDRMFDDLTSLASDEYGGRAPATEGNDLAVDYVESIFADLGLVPVGEDGTYRQHFPYDRWDLTDPSTLALDGDGLVEGTEFRPLTRSGSGSATGAVVFAGYGLTVPPFDPAAYPDCPVDPGGYDDYAGLDPTGAVVLAMRRGPGNDEAIADECPIDGAALDDGDHWDFGYKAANARELGATGLLLVQNYAHSAALIEGEIGGQYYDADFPVLTVDRDVMEGYLPSLPDWADAIDDTYQPASATTELQADLSVSAETVVHLVPNLLGAVEGSGDEVVVIGAHIDHLGTDPITGEIYHGADDNGSGTTVMVELARMLVGSGLQPERTVLFAAFNAEEDGLIGSCYYVGDPSYAHEDTVAVISVDMVGAGDGQGLNLYGALYEDYTWLAQLMDLAAAEQGLPYDTWANMPVLASDHVCFITQGTTAVMAQTTGSHPVYHTPDDDIDHVSADNLEAAAELMWAALVPLTMATEGPYLDQEWDPLGD